LIGRATATLHVMNGGAPDSLLPVEPWGFEYDDRAFPLVVVSYFRLPTEADVLLLERLLDETFARERPLVMVSDLQAAGTVSAEDRRRAGRLFTRFEEASGRFCRAAIVALRSDLLRSSVTAIQLMARSRHPIHYVRDLRAAAFHAEQALHAANLPIGPRVCARLDAMRHALAQTG
jgi:hypothetical protein